MSYDMCELRAAIVPINQDPHLNREKAANVSLMLSEAVEGSMDTQHIPLRLDPASR